MKEGFKLENNYNKNKEYSNNKNKRRNKIKKSKLSIPILIINIISVIVIIISIYYIYLWYLDNKNTKETIDNIFENANISEKPVTLENNVQTGILTVDFDNLKSKNSDTVGWIRVLGTDVNYPVVQTTNNDFYINHSFDKSYNKAGWIFADYTNTNIKNEKLDKNTVIYGHNRQNNSMFGTLTNTLKKNWQENESNRYINFSTPTKNMVWEVFSTYTIDAETYYIKTHFSSDKEYEEFLNTIKNRSNYNFNVDVSASDYVLTLSTCTNIGNGRAVVHAKLIKD